MSLKRVVSGELDRSVGITYKMSEMSFRVPQWPDVPAHCGWRSAALKIEASDIGAEKMLQNGKECELRTRSLPWCGDPLCGSYCSGLSCMEVRGRCLCPASPGQRLARSPSKSISPRDACGTHRPAQGCPQSTGLFLTLIPQGAPGCGCVFSVQVVGVCQLQGHLRTPWPASLSTTACPILHLLLNSMLGGRGDSETQALSAYISLLRHGSQPRTNLFIFMWCISFHLGMGRRPLASSSCHPFATPGHPSSQACLSCGMETV